MAAGALYRAELAAGIRALGFAIRQVQRGGSLTFEVDGVPRNLTEHFSKRRAEIEEKLELELGGLDTATARASEIAALDTRRKKAQEQPRSEMIGQWQDIGRQFGFTEEHVRSLRTETRTPRPEEREPLREQVFARAIRTVEETQAHCSERDLVRRVAEHAQGSLAAAEVRELVEEHIQLSGRIVNLGELKTGERNDKLRQYVERCEDRYATPEMIELERLVHRLAGHIARKSHEVPTEHVEAALRRKPTLSEEQALAVRHLCSGGGLRLCTGDAGTGKSFMLGACREAWEADGRTVLGCALAGAAAKELEKSAGIKSGTLHTLLAKLKHGTLTIDHRSVVVLDEAGMVGTRLFAKLAAHVAKARAKLVCVGDAKQLAPIEAGWIFKRLGEQHGEVRLTKVRRQEVPWQLEAGVKMGRKQTLEALIDYQARGRLVVTTTTRVAIRELVTQWVADGGVKDSTDKLILAGTQAEAAEINAQCQARRLLAGELKAEAKVFHREFFLYEGDRILFSKRMGRKQIENSWMGTVEAVRADRGEIAVRLDADQRLMTLKLSELPEDAVRRGYATTTHKAQGKTVDSSYILLGGPMTSNHLGYVQLTRHRHDCRLYLAEADAGPDLKVAARALARTENKSLAVELLERPREPSRRPQRPSAMGVSP
ncbi:hypothetical protein BH23PLA1_BH23PLA1_41000 [soil metagenome]